MTNDPEIKAKNSFFILATGNTQNPRIRPTCLGSSGHIGQDARCIIINMCRLQIHGSSCIGIHVRPCVYIERGLIYTEIPCHVQEGICVLCMTVLHYDMCSNVFLMLPIYMDIGNKYKARGVGENIVVFFIIPIILKCEENNYIDHGATNDSHDDNNADTYSC